MQDAVVAATAPQWCTRLAGVPLYVMREDLQARGLQQRIGLDLDMAGLVALIAEKARRRPGLADCQFYIIISASYRYFPRSLHCLPGSNCINLDSLDNRA